MRLCVSLRGLEVELGALGVLLGNLFFLDRAAKTVGELKVGDTDVVNSDAVFAETSAELVVDIFFQRGAVSDKLAGVVFGAGAFENLAECW